MYGNAQGRAGEKCRLPRGIVHRRKASGRRLSQRNQERRLSLILNILAFKVWTVGRDRLQDIHVKWRKKEMTAFSVILSMEEVEKGKNNNRLPAKDGSQILHLSYQTNPNQLSYLGKFF